MALLSRLSCLSVSELASADNRHGNEKGKYYFDSQSRISFMLLKFRRRFLQEQGTPANWNRR